MSHSFNLAPAPETLPEKAREEVMQLKWLMSEQAKRDVGWDAAYHEWIRVKSRPLQPTYIRVPRVRRGFDFFKDLLTEDEWLFYAWFVACTGLCVYSFLYPNRWPTIVLRVIGVANLFFASSILKGILLNISIMIIGFGISSLISWMLM